LDVDQDEVRVALARQPDVLFAGLGLHEAIPLNAPYRSFSPR